MPIARVVEYKIALPSDYALDLLLGLGKLGYFMPLTRPSTLPSPRLPQRYVDRVRRLEDLSRELSRVLQEYSVDPPTESRPIRLSSFEEALNLALEEGEDLMKRINQYLTSINNLRADVDYAKKILDASRAVTPNLDLRFLTLDIVPMGSRDFEEFRRSVESYGGEAILIKDGLALVIYPKWSSGDVATVYKVFGTSPLRIPESLDPQDASRRVEELEVKLSRLEDELRNYLRNTRDRAYMVMDLANALGLIMRQYAESAIPEGREIREKLNSMVELMRSAESRLREVELLRMGLEGLRRMGLRGPEVLRLRSRVFVVKGEPKISLGAHVSQDIGNGYSLLIIFDAPRELEPESLGDEVVEIGSDYLSDVEASLSLLNRELNNLRSRLGDARREYDEVVRDFNEVSSFGIEGMSNAGDDTVTIAGYVREDLVANFEDELAELISRLAIDVRVRRESRVIYLRNVDPEKAPTLEVYPRLVGVFKKIVYMYGVPKYLEVSPVPLTAFLFPFFYGWMFPDIGHGLLLVMFGYLLMRLRYSGGNRFMRIIFSGKYSDWGLIFLMSGLWSIVFTFIETGTVFGIEIHNYLEPPFPLISNGNIVGESINAILAMSMITGVLALVGSFALKIVNTLREGDVELALLFDAPLLAFFLFLTLLFVSMNLVPITVLLGTGIPSLGYLGPLLSSRMYYWLTLSVVSLVVLVVGILTLRSRRRGVVGFDVARLASGVFAEGFTASIANTISFMRLGVIAIVHVIFTGLVVSGAYSFGLLTPLGLIILIIGNLGVAFGEGFVAFIQSLRLHFYEIFTKFFEGNGIPFTPLTLGLRYIKLS